MRDSKLLVIIFLLFLLLASIGGLLFLYKQNNDIKTAKEASVKIVVAAKDIPQNQKITKEDLKVISMAKSNVQFDVLLEREIIDKYAAVPIFKEEPIRKEKISKLIEKEDINSTAKKANHDLYNIKLDLFQNPNYTLHSGDIVDIVGVWGDTVNDPTVKYIAKSIDVYGFFYKGALEEDALHIETTIHVNPKTKEKVEQQTPFKSEEIVLDTQANVIKSIIEAHNRGHQLWMVQSGAESREELLKSIATPAPVVTAYTPSQPKRRKTAATYPKASIAYGTGNEKVTVWK